VGLADARSRPYCGLIVNQGDRHGCQTTNQSRQETTRAHEGRTAFAKDAKQSDADAVAAEVAQSESAGQVASSHGAKESKRGAGVPRFFIANSPIFH